MRITTIAEARELVGRTFERDGKRRTVTRIEHLSTGQGGALCGDVYWCRPGSAERQRPQWLFDFLTWHEKATEITNG